MSIVTHLRPISRTILTIMMAAGSASVAANPAGEILDDFSAGGWTPSNPKAPAEVSYGPGRMVLRDLPGGEVDWGASAARRFPDVDLNATPYLVLEVGQLGGGFAVRMSGGRDRPKADVLSGDEPGLYVVDLREATGWKDDPPGMLVVNLYTRGDGTTAEYHLFKLTGELTDGERKVLERLNAKRPPRAPPFAGLTAMASRRLPPPDPHDGSETERAIYRDPVTGAEVWRMTAHPSIERHVYYDIPAWNANGSLLFFLSRRTRERNWLMDADGRNLRPLPRPADGGPAPKAAHWHPLNPTRMLFARPGPTETEVFELDVDSGDVTRIASVPIPAIDDGRKFAELCPPHPDGRGLLLRWGSMDRQNTLLAVVDAAKGTWRRIEVGFPTHRVRFTKSPDHVIFVNRNFDPDSPADRDRTNWLLDPDGSLRAIPSAGGHPDWNPDGTLLAGYDEGAILLIDPRRNSREPLVEIKAGGHGGFSITTGAYHVSDAPASGPFGNMIFVTELATGSVTPIAWHGSSYSGWGSGVPDPEATHPAPVCSPDETKIVYDSDVLGQPDVFVAVWKRPGAPSTVSWSQNVLRWNPPELHRELSGYSIYRRAGGEWAWFRDVPADRREIQLPEGEYAVASRERSGLESTPTPAEGGAPPVIRAPTPPGRPEAIGVGDTWVRLRWPAAPEPDVSHYNVYAGTTADFAPDRAALIRSPHLAEMTDWGIEPESGWIYRVTAVNRQGAESPPGPPLRVVLKPGDGASTAAPSTKRKP